MLAQVASLDHNLVKLINISDHSKCQITYIFPHPQWSNSMQMDGQIHGVAM